MKTKLKDYYKKGYIYSLSFILIFVVFTLFHKNILLKEYYNYIDFYLLVNKTNLDFYNTQNNLHEFIEADTSFNNPKLNNEFNNNSNKLTKEFDMITNNHRDYITDEFVDLQQLMKTYQVYATDIFTNKASLDKNYLSTLENQILDLGKECYINFSNKIYDGIKAIKRNAFIITLAIHILFLLLILWFLHFFHTLSKRLIEPLDTLGSNLNQIESTKDNLQINTDTFQEIQQIILSLNTMLEKLNKAHSIEIKNKQLENQLLIKEMDLIKQDELLTKSKLKMLQNQINPHFLFNTLNMIHGLILTKQPEVASSMILKTSAILRYGLYTQNETSTIQQELDAIHNYIDIQKQRFGNRIDFVFNIHNLELIKDIPIPGMIFQPIVENAIKHGLSDIIDDAEIEFYIDYHSSILTIEISDNGCGMDQAEVDEKLALIYSDQYNDSHLGLYNVIKRLTLFYKQRVDIQITTAKNCGFSVQININVKEGINYDSLISSR